MKILIIDDDKEICSLLMTVLEKFGYQTLAAGDGERGLELLRLHPDVVLVLLDWMLPGKSGLEVLEILQKEEASPPVIMMSARRRKEDILLAIETGCVDYVAKPIHLGSLVRKIQNALQAHRSEAEMRSAMRPDLNLECFTEFNIVNISETGCGFVSTFPLERDTVLFLESDEIAAKLNLPEGQGLPVRVANCTPVGRRFRIGAQFVFLPADIGERLRRLCRS